MLGEELRKARTAAGLTQEKLAIKAGLTCNYVSLLELDRKSPTVKTFFVLCKALGVRPSTLIARVERAESRSGTRR